MSRGPYRYGAPMAKIFFATFRVRFSGCNRGSPEGMRCVAFLGDRHVSFRLLNCLKDMTKSIPLLCLNIPRSPDGIISHHYNTTDTDFVLTHWDKSSQ